MLAMQWEVTFKNLRIGLRGHTSAEVLDAETL